MDTPLHFPVLVVDDDDDVRDTLRALLESEGYVVADAATIADALVYLWTTVLIHVVLLDFLLPQENADVLLRTVENNERLRRHCFVLMPATPITWFSVEAQRLIADLCSEVVMKPFELTTLLAAVARAETQLAAKP